MEIKLDQTLTDIKGVPFKNGETELKLREIVFNSLLGEFEGETLSGTEKYNRYMLAKKVHAASESIEMSPEEIVSVKNLIGKMYKQTIVSGQAWGMFEEDKDGKL